MFPGLNILNSIQKYSKFEPWQLKKLIVLFTSPIKCWRKKNRKPAEKKASRVCNSKLKLIYMYKPASVRWFW